MRIAPVVQGVFYVVTGLWPVVHYRSFEAVTGVKKEPWLVQTTGALITAIGVALLTGSRERSRAMTTLGLASAAVLGAADLYFVRKRRVPRTYLLDSAAESAMIATWLVAGDDA